MKQFRYIPFYIALFSINASHALPSAQYWNNLLHYVSEHKETVTKNQPVLMGAAGIIGAYGLWRFAKHKKAESLYCSAKIIHAKLSDKYIQECALIDEAESLDTIIKTVAHERMQPLHGYLEEIAHAVNTTHILHDKLHRIKTYVAGYHSDIQRVLNNLAQLHNSLFRIKKQVFSIMGLQLCEAFTEEYVDEIVLLADTFPQLSHTKTLRLIDFANDAMRNGLHTIIMQKYNTPTMQHPYLAYFTELQSNMNQLHESLNDIDQNHAAYTKISRLLAQLRIIGKFVVTDKNYIQEKQNAQEQLCLKEVNEKLDILAKSINGMEKRVGQLETKPEIQEDVSETTQE